MNPSHTGWHDYMVTGATTCRIRCPVYDQDGVLCNSAATQRSPHMPASSSIATITVNWRTVNECCGKGAQCIPPDCFTLRRVKGFLSKITILKHTSQHQNGIQVCKVVPHTPQGQALPQPRPLQPTCHHTRWGACSISVGACHHTHMSCMNHRRPPQL